MYAFTGTLRVAPGAHLIVVNKDSVEHTLTATGGAFDTGRIAGNGGSASFTAPTRAGSYAFYCQIHPYMTGTLVVV